MTSKKTKELIKRLKACLPYILTGAITLALVFFGSLDKTNAGMSLSLDTFAESGYNVSVDQVSAMYVVADVSNALNLASAPDVASNYVIVTSMREVGQSATGKIEKPTITDLVVSRGVLTHIVAEGETMDSIAAKYGISTDHIRWSNGRKNKNVGVGELLYIPSVPGIVYTVKANQTVEQIASTYGSSAAEIIALNDLETTGLTAGTRILIKGGSLPEKERPEYVPPAPRRTVYTYTTLGNTAARQDIQVLGYFYNLGGPYGRGQCTQWAWYKRQSINPVPANWGNANTWAARAAAQGYTVVRGKPVAGAIFQNSSGWYGHVGFVESVNPDGSFVGSEMNYGYQPYRAIRSTIPAAAAANMNYIYP